MKPLTSPLRKYSSYALAAAALGSPEAQAAIIHVDHPDTVYTSNASNPFDLNGDGVTDYVLELLHGTDPSDHAYVFWHSQGSNYISVDANLIPASLYAGFLAQTFMDYDPFYGGSPLWNNQQSVLWGKLPGNIQGQMSNLDLSSSLYFGLLFDIAGEYHFGWVRLSSAGDKGVQASAIVHEWAYETVPGRPIAVGATSSPPDPVSDVPEPASLALFAMGAAGMAAFKRRRRNG